MKKTNWQEEYELVNKEITNLEIKADAETDDKRLSSIEKRLENLYAERNQIELELTPKTEKVLKNKKATTLVSLLQPFFWGLIIIMVSIGVIASIRTQIQYEKESRYKTDVTITTAKGNENEGFVVLDKQRKDGKFEYTLVTEKEVI